MKVSSGWILGLSYCQALTATSSHTGPNSVNDIEQPVRQPLLCQHGGERGYKTAPADQVSARV